MRPVNPINPLQNELISHIKDTLIVHEEDYVPGSWESFNYKAEKTKGMAFWLSRLSGIAAVLLIFIGLFFFMISTRVKLPVETVDIKPGKNVQPKMTTKDKNEGANKLNGKVSNKNNRTDTKERIKNLPPLNSLSKITLSNHSLLYKNKNEVPVSSKVPSLDKNIESPVLGITANEASKQIYSQVVTRKSDVHSGTSFQKFLDNETHTNKLTSVVNKKDLKKNKWSMGLVVAPSFGNTKKLNMGYGVSMGYNLSDKISLNSGVSYNDMAASRTSDASVTTAIAGGAKNLESVEAKFSGIDIPLEVQYNLNKNLYANVGISAFTVLSQQKNNNFIEEKLIQQSVSNAMGIQELRTFVVNERVTEQVPDADINESRYLGFYNFSFGYKRKILKNNSVSIEPFMKVPMKEVTKETLPLVGTGVRLRLDF